MKIRLPNPKEFLGREELWFEQLELSVYHAKKAWNKILDTYSREKEESGDMPWIQLVHEADIEEAIEKSMVDVDYETRGNLEIEIAEP